MTDKDKAFFVGWAELPKTDRRFFLQAGAVLSVSALAGAAGVAVFQRAVGSGAWDLSETREYRGILVSSPYPMLLTRDVSGELQTALLVCETKCGVQARLQNLSDGAVVVRGTPIVRGPHAMIAVSEEMEWIRRADEAPDIGISVPKPVSLGEYTLNGEVLDTKCWFGAMNPSEGKPHKSCASLCIRGGIPPAFYVRDVREQSALMILTHRGRGFGPELLPFVADPVSIRGTLQQAGDLLMFDTSVDAIEFLT
ncbi:MAG: hypothetical protein AAF578_03330 [Pseudomonadota bacterium]